MPKSYLLKDAALDDMFAAVRAVAASGTVLPPGITAKLAARQRVPRLSELTDREIDVLTCVARGQSNATEARSDLDGREGHRGGDHRVVSGTSEP